MGYNEKVWTKVYELYRELWALDKFRSLENSMQDLIIFSKLPRIINAAEVLGKKISFSDIESRLSERGFNRTIRLDTFEAELCAKLPIDLESFRKEAEMHIGLSEKPSYRRQKFDIEG